LLSSQEIKFEAVDRELVFSCADLTDSPALDVRVNAALALASLVLHNSVRGEAEIVGRREGRIQTFSHNVFMIGSHGQ
jgi:hypothetical protein